jgi:hypothetical protein
MSVAAELTKEEIEYWDKKAGPAEPARPRQEWLMRPIKDENGRVLAPDEALSNWLYRGTVSELPPAYDDTEAPMPERFSSPEVLLLGPKLAGRQPWLTHKRRELLDELPASDKWLLYRHDGQQKSFSRIAREDGVSKQACSQRYDRIRDRLTGKIAALPDVDELEGPYSVDEFRTYPVDEWRMSDEDYLRLYPADEAVEDLDLDDDLDEDLIHVQVDLGREVSC